MDEHTPAPRLSDAALPGTGRTRGIAHTRAAKPLGRPAFMPIDIVCSMLVRRPRP